MANTTLVLIRHGQSQWNLENKFTGWVDVPLTAKGEEEAKAAGHLLANYTFDIAYTSKLQRAQNTLKMVLAESGNNNVPTIEDVALNERMYGDLQGLDKTETEHKFGVDQVKIWRRSYDIAPPNGESLKDTAVRVLPYYESIILPQLQAGKNIIVAAHGNSLRALIMDIEKMTPDEILAFEIPTATPRVYVFDENMNILEKRFLK
ncbi:MAG: 2,3-diphosphoglycerate-dependent phosphoglycerate mutase [Bacteroidota bacterium]